MSHTSAPTPPEWTSQQRAAIEDRGHNLAVTASAGSGKTAVLTERVVRLIVEAEEGTSPEAGSLERMLLITFTEKAARQMKERIEGRIGQALLERPGSPALRQAMESLPTAWIMTIDAFCRRIVTENFHIANVSPTVRIPESAELAQLEGEAIQGVIEERAAGGETDRENIKQLLRCYHGAADELIKDVLKLINFHRSLAQPDRWLARARREMEEALAAPTYESLPDASAAHEVFARETRRLAEALGKLAILAHHHGAPSDRIDHWGGMASELKRLSATQPLMRLDPLRQWVVEVADQELGKIQNKGQCGVELYQNKGFIRNVLKPFSKHYEKWRERWFALDEAGWLRGGHLAARQGLALIDLAEAVRRRIDQAKQRRGWISFNDQVRLALGVLSDPDNLGAPSAVAHQLRQRFDHVMVDEYQDTSPLQDAIIARVTRSPAPTPGTEGNLFIVGDFKQSIYRFRHAEPALFQRKLELFKPIALTDNFRSRPGITEFINACFQRLIDRDLGEMEYDDLARLKPWREDPPGSDPVCVEIRWMPKNTGERNEDARNTNDGDDEEPFSGVEVQAVWVARRIRELTDSQNGLTLPVNPAETDPPSMARPGDCAILLRGLKNERDLWVEALGREGLAVRTPGLSHLMTAPELIDLIAALRIADNPFQDIALAALMRSPLGGFSDDDLLDLRLRRTEGPFHEAVWAAAGQATGGIPTSEPILSEAKTDPPSQPLMAKELKEKLGGFMGRIDRWRDLARRSEAPQVLDAILSDTEYEAHLMGRPDAPERLQHLDYLRGLMGRLGRPDEGANPLASFLESLDRTGAEGGNLNEMPESVADRMGAVNLMTIHKAKGLEFPIVFLPRLERPIQAKKLTTTLLDGTAGIARAGIDVERRRIYPTLAQRRLSETLRLKERSEELRLLYVAMTRAKERLILVGQVAKIDDLSERWGLVRTMAGEPMGTLDRLGANSPADLIGPIVEWLHSRDRAPSWLRVDTDPNLPATTPPVDLEPLLHALTRTTAEPPEPWSTVRETLQSISPSPSEKSPVTEESPPLHLLPTWDPAEGLTILPAKTTVTQLRRGRRGFETVDEGDPEELERFLEEEMQRPYFTREGDPTSRRPAWTQAPQGTTPVGGAERGTLTHQFLAQLDPRGSVAEDGLRQQAARLQSCGLLGRAGNAATTTLEAIDYESIGWFFETEIGREIIDHPDRTLRELPFTAIKAIHDFDPQAAQMFAGESILVQGIIDVVIDQDDRATILDYKTDRVGGPNQWDELIEHHGLQIEQYARALQSIWRLREVRTGLVFLDARRIGWMKPGEG